MEVPKLRWCHRSQIIVMAKIKNSTSMKSKKRSSVVLTAVAASDSRLQCVDISEVGDDSVWCFEDVYKDCGSQPLPISDANVHLVIIGNESFPLMEHIMPPYQRKVMDNGMKNFNDRLQKATVPIDIAFEVLTQKFKILTAANSSIKTAIQLTIKTTCLLYNVMLDIDRDNDLDFIQARTYGYEFKHDLMIKKKMIKKKPTDRAVEIRNEFKNYFAST